MAPTAPPVDSQSPARPPTSAEFFNDNWQIGERIITYNSKHGWIYVTDKHGGILERITRVTREHWDSGTLENPSVQQSTVTVGSGLHTPGPSIARPVPTRPADPRPAIPVPRAVSRTHTPLPRTPAQQAVTLPPEPTPPPVAPREPTPAPVIPRAPTPAPPPPRDPTPAPSDLSYIDEEMTTPETQNKVSERRIRAPNDFDGKRDEANSFLLSCRTYLRLNKQSYPTDEEQIIFILSHMVGGSAGPFADSYMVKAFATDPTTQTEKGFGTFTAFVEEFNTAFSPLDPVDDAITRMKSLKQTAKADDYVAEFRPLALRSGINQVAVLSDYFLSGLNTGLVRNIMSVEKLPTTMDGYYELATRLDLQWRKGQELTRGNNPKKPQNPNTTQSASTRGPSDTKGAARLRKLTAEERNKLFKEGRCFRCREQGHRSAECPKSQETPPQRRQIRVASSGPSTGTVAAAEPPPQAPISRIRAVFNELTPAEKEEVVNIAEAEGF